MLSVIIPAYNEEKTLAAVLDKVLSLPLRPEVIVVDDGSKDGTAEIIRHYQAQRGIIGVICPKNGGKGAAIAEGLKYATQPYTVIQDADLEYDPEQFKILLDPVRAKGVQVVYGSRNMRHPAALKNHFHYLRFWLGGKVVTLVANFLFGVHLTDEATCYKLFPTELLRRMNLECRGFDFCPEVTAKALRLGYKIHEVPIRYTPRSLSEGKKIRSKDGFIAMWVLLKYRLMPRHWMFNRRQPAAVADSVSAVHSQQFAGAQHPAGAAPSHAAITEPRELAVSSAQS